MSTLGRKTFQDILQEGKRSILVVVSIAAGVAALLAFLGSSAILTRETNLGYLATNPASAILHLKSVDERALATVRADPEVEEVEARRTLIGRIKTGPAQWQTLALFVIPDYGDIRLNRFLPEQGSWPPAIGDVLLERDAFQVAHAAIGDSVTFRLNDGPPQELRVSGRVHDVGQAQARMENTVYGYITVDTLARLVSDPYLDSLLIKPSTRPYNPDHVREVATHVKQQLEAEGYLVRGIDDPTPGHHPHADLMGGLFLAISCFGVFLVALSGILALNFIDAMMTGQIRQIGVMKAIGGSRLQLAGIYLTQALVLGCMATMIALPLGIWGSHKLCLAMGTFLNFDVSSFQIPVWVFLLVLATGVGIPLLACAVPLSRAVSIPVRRALAGSGTSSDHFGSGLFDRVLAGIGGIGRPVLLATRNSFRKRMRLILTCMTLAFAGMFFMAALNLRTSMIDTFDLLFGAERYDLTLDLDQMYSTDKIDRALHAIPGVLASENWIVGEGWIPKQSEAGKLPQASAPIADNEEQMDEEPRNRFAVVAIPLDSQLYVPAMAYGRRLRLGDADTVVLNPTLAAQNPKLKVGDEVRLHIGSTTKIWRVVGICREPLLPRPTAYVPTAALASLHPGKANLVQVALKDPTHASLESAREQIDPRFEEEGIKIAGGRPKSDFRASVDQHVLMIYVFLVFASCVVGGVGALGLTTTMGINVLERRREIGVLRAIGATPKMVFAIVIGEAVTVGSIAWAISVVLADPVGRLLAEMVGRMLHTQFDAHFAAVGVGASLVASVGLAALASLVAAISAVRLTVPQALAYE